MRVHAFTPAIFPNAGVRLESELCGLLTKGLDRAKQRRIAWVRQPAIKKHRCSRHYDAAIHIVLALIAGCVADPHRSIPAISGKSRGSSLFEHIRVDDAVKRSHRLAAAARHAQYVKDKIFHRARRADTIERAHDEEGIAHPAEPVIPVAT